MTRRSKRAPRRSSLGYKRKRASSSKPYVRGWPRYEGEPKILGFPGFKAGMTRIIYREENQKSHVKGQRIAAVTVIETPPVILLGFRTYKQTPYGLKILNDVMTNSPNKNIKRNKRFPKFENVEEQISKMEETIEKAVELRAVIHTQPDLTGFPQKRPEIIELKVGAKSVNEAFNWVRDRVGQELQIEDFAKPGEYVDVIGITKGSGFSGVVKRHGVTRVQHKTKDGVRRVGSVGPWKPARIKWLIARYGQYGYFRRTEYNKQVMKLGADGDEVTPNGGFIKYGIIKNRYILLKGSVPGPKKRLVMLRQGMRSQTKDVVEPQLSYISTTSQQR